MDFPDPGSIKTGFDLVKGAIDTVKGLSELYRSKPEAHKEIEEKIKLAQRQLELGEAQLAQALGYRLCRAHFPPVPMLRSHINPTYIEEVSRCPDCGVEDPSPEYFAQKDRVKAQISSHNRGGSWMSA